MTGIKSWGCFEVRVAELVQLLKVPNLRIASDFWAIKSVWHGRRVNMVDHWPVEVDTFINVCDMLILNLCQHLSYTIIHWLRPQRSRFIPLLVCTVTFLLLLLLLLAFHDEC